MHTDQEFRQWCQNKDIPLISPETENLIYTILQKIEPQYCIEIGSAVGYSGTVISASIQSRWGQLYSFEVAHNVYTQALWHTKHIPNITIYPRSPIDTDMSKLILWSYDFVFIDGQKAQYDQYLMKIRPFLCKESVVICDDVIKFQNKLTSLYRYLEKMQIFYQILQTEQDDGIMLIGDQSVITNLIDHINHQ